MISIKTLGSSSRGNCHFLTDGVTPVLLDCGVQWRKIREGLQFKTSNLAGILVTHDHKDHCKGVEGAVKAGIEVYMSKGTAEMINCQNHRINIIKAKKQFRLGTWFVLPFDVKHDAAEPLGFLLANVNGKKILYATDSYYIKYMFNNLTHLLLECNYSQEILNKNVERGIVPSQQKKRVIKSHMSLETALNFLKANDLSKVEEIHLIHLSNFNSDAALFKREVMALTGKPVIVADP